jgi:predicted MPP superfamily phosphohydrolase
LHRGTVVSRAYLEECIAAANAAQPDLIALTGDYLTDHGDGQQQVRGYVRDVAACVALARARYGVFASLGNHDHWFDADYVTDALREAGATVLRNENWPVVVNGATLPVAGLGDLWTEPPEFPRAFGGVSNGCALVLMHNPDSFHEWRQPGSQLILSGHTHGGQVNVPLYGPPVVPSRYGPLYARGWFRRGDAQMYVSRGVGLISPAVRFNCAPELPVFELRAA